jgi:hypothetical protein
MLTECRGFPLVHHPRWTVANDLSFDFICDQGSMMVLLLLMKAQVRAGVGGTRIMGVSRA